MAPRLRPAIAALALAGLLWPTASAWAGAPAPRDVTMRDNRFDPVTPMVGQGRAVRFTNFGRVVHDARDGTGLDLFATDLLPPPESETIDPLPGAGSYRYVCTFHPEMVGRLRVPVTASPASAPTRSRVTVRWATSRAPAGLVFDVQRRRPGTTRFVAWRNGVVAPSAAFRSTERGQWAFRARVRRPADGSRSAWSPTRFVRVT